MAIRNIRLDSDPILRKISREVDKIDDRIINLVRDMEETMYHAEGVGLAAPQVGVLRRVVLVDVGEGLYTLINPEITDKSGQIMGNEACLSVPGKFGSLNRPEKITVKYTNIDGDEKVIEAEGFFARALCHEIDHLNGILYTDLAEEIYINEEK